MANTIKVNTKFFATIREITGRKEDALILPSGSTITVFIQELSKRYGANLTEYMLDEKGSLRGSLSLLLNGQAIANSKLDTSELKDDDLIVILPPVGGG